MSAPFDSPPPKVTLIRGFGSDAFDNAMATARTCYSSRIITAEDVRKDDKAIALRLLAEPSSADTQRALHVTIAAVREELDNQRFNTAIAKLIEFNNHLTKLGGCPADCADALVQMLAPFAPHTGEELWARLGHTGSLTHEAFPVADPALLVADTVEYPVQINGKVRGRVVVAATATNDEVQAAAMADDKVQAALAGLAPKKVIVVPGRMVNIVA